MSTVLRINGFSVVIHTHDHPPPHVHVLCAGDEEEMVIRLQPVRIRDIRGMKVKHMVQAVRIVDHYAEILLESWREIHG
jgi:hypothetical protein